MPKKIQVKIYEMDIPNITNALFVSLYFIGDSGVEINQVCMK